MIDGYGADYYSEMLRITSNMSEKEKRYIRRQKEQKSLEQFGIKQIKLKQKGYGTIILMTLFIVVLGVLFLSYMTIERYMNCDGTLTKTEVICTKQLVNNTNICIVCQDVLYQCNLRGHFEAVKKLDKEIIKECD